MSQLVSNNLSIESSSGSGRMPVDLNSSMSDAYETMSSDSASVGFDSSSEGGMSTSPSSRYSSSFDDEFESDYSGSKLDSEHGIIFNSTLSFT
jgi:hypothetical protein